MSKSIIKTTSLIFLIFLGSISVTRKTMAMFQQEDPEHPLNITIKVQQVSDITQELKKEWPKEEPLNVREHIKQVIQVMDNPTALSQLLAPHLEKNYKVAVQYFDERKLINEDSRQLKYTREDIDTVHSYAQQAIYNNELTLPYYTLLHAAYLLCTTTTTEEISTKNAFKMWLEPNFGKYFAEIYNADIDLEERKEALSFIKISIKSFIPYDLKPLLPDIFKTIYGYSKPLPVHGALFTIEDMNFAWAQGVSLLAFSPQYQHEYDWDTFKDNPFQIFRHDLQHTAPMWALEGYPYSFKGSSVENTFWTNVKIREKQARAFSVLFRQAYNKISEIKDEKARSIAEGYLFLVFHETLFNIKKEDLTIEQVFNAILQSTMATTTIIQVPSFEHLISGKNADPSLQDFLSLEALRDREQSKRLYKIIRSNMGTFVDKYVNPNLG